jgi:hypothetical protein
LGEHDEQAHDVDGHGAQAGRAEVDDGQGDGRHNHDRHNHDRHNHDRHGVDEQLVVVVDADADARMGLLVDELIGQRQVVLKSLEANYRGVPGVSGATILSDGRAALILDVAALRLLAAPGGGPGCGGFPANAPSTEYLQ